MLFRTWTYKIIARYVSAWNKIILSSMSIQNEATNRTNNGEDDSDFRVGDR